MEVSLDTTVPSRGRFFNFPGARAIRPLVRRSGRFHGIIPEHIMERAVKDSLERSDLWPGR